LRATGRNLTGAVVAVVTASLAGGVAAAGAAASAVRSVPAAVSASANWPAYLDGPLHRSYAPAETAITPATVPDLRLEWHDTLGGIVLASPTVANGAVYVGSKSGWFYKLDEQTGKVLDKFFIGHRPALTCGAMGVVSTAAYAYDRANGQAIVYVAGPDGYLYALSAGDLSLVWRSVIAIPSTKTSNYYDWSSPTVANGKIYIGVSSNCDNPQIRGGVIAYQQATGKRIAEFYTVPKGSIGGSVWASIAVGPDGDVYVSTGNGPKSKELLGYSDSVVKLSGSSLKLLGWFQVPVAQSISDGDFGSSPLIFGKYVGACNKNGIYYLLSQSTMKVVWQQQVGVPFGQDGEGSCLATPAYNGKDLFIGGDGTTIGATSYYGSVQERVPSTGALVWETGLPAAVVGSPTLDGGGVVAAGMWNGNKPEGIDLIDAATGAIIRLLVPGTVFAQSVFAGGWLFCGTPTGVYAWGLK
jgi:outer membrane protein assembly factor BamB